VAAAATGSWSPPRALTNATDTTAATSANAAAAVTAGVRARRGCGSIESVTLLLRLAGAAL
jgi:hypothetical protein